MAEQPGENQENDTESAQHDQSTVEDMVVCLPNQQKTGEQYKNNSRRYDDSDEWIVVRSRNRSGYFYDFNVKTGEKHWRDPAVTKVEPDHGAKEGKEIPFCGLEPTKPADDPPASCHDTAPKIYNKQIINNQFPFGNAPYASNNSTAWSMPSPIIYPWAVPPPVLINSATPFHQAQTVFGPLPIPAQNTFSPLSSTLPTFNQAQTTGYGSMPNLPLQNISGPFNTTTLNQAQTVVGPLPNLPGQNTSASVNSTIPPSSQAQGYGSMPNLPVENLSGPFNTPLNQAQTLLGPLPNLSGQNTLVPVNSTMPPLSQAQGYGSMPNLPVQNLSGPFKTPPLNQVQTVVGPLTNVAVQNTLAPLNSTVPPLSQAHAGFGSLPNVPVENLSGPWNTLPINQAQTVVGPLTNVAVQNTLAPVNSTVSPLSQAQAGYGSMPNVPAQNLSDPFNTPSPPLNQAQTVVGPLTNVAVQNTSAPVNSTVPPLSQAQAGYGSMPNVPAQNLSGPLNTPSPPLKRAQIVVGPLTNLAVKNTLAPVNSTMPPLSQAQAGFKPLPNLPIKNSSVSLSNRFQVLKQFNRKSPANSVKSRLGFKSPGNFPPRNQQNYMRRETNDLRSLLSGRNRQDLNEEIKQVYPAKMQTKEDIPASLDEDEIHPDDIDEWLEDHTDDEGKKLTVDMECIWKLADITASRESWYIVPTAIVLLNNIRFFTSLLISDERARLLAPLSVIRALRSATFAESARVADCAKRAMSLIRQSSKHPDTPKNLPNVSSCLELIDQNKLVVLLFEENDKERREIINDIPIFSVTQLKQYLTNAIASVLKVENITIVVPNKEDETQSIPSDIALSQRIEQSLVLNKVPETQFILRDNLTLSHLIDTSLAPNKIAETPSVLRDNLTLSHRIKPSPLPNKEAETQTIPKDYRTPSLQTSEKQTVNASVQTDFQFILVPAEKGHEEESDKSVTKIDLEVNTGETCNKDINKKTPSKKIRLKRQHQPLKISVNHEIKTFKWRKRKETSTPNSSLSQVDSCHKSYSSPSTSTGDLQHLVTQQDVKAAKLEVGDVGVDEQLNRPIVEPASSDVDVDVQLNDNVVEPASSDVGVDLQLNDNVVEPASSDVADDVQLNDNVVEPAFSDVGVNTKTVDETSTSNSIDGYGLFQTKQPFLNELKDLSKDSNAHKEIEYEVTSEFMKEHLNSRCDEWVSRFTQIMEEVLTQILHMDPPYIDKSLPPPWNVQEATACINRKLRSHTIIFNASNKFLGFLHKISDDRGNIRTDIRPEDFMEMYSYGVNLVNVLQMVLKHEDLQIASEYLSQLLSDIREPNLDLSQEFETLCGAGSPNISESITNISITDAPASNTAPAVIESPQPEEKCSSNNSPARYTLRSSQRSSRAQNKQRVDDRTEVVCDGQNDQGYCLFSSLGLQKNNFKPDASICKTMTNVPQDKTHQTSPTIPTDLVSDNIQEHTGVNVAEPKNIRKFEICPNIENKLSDNNVIKEVDYALLLEEYVSGGLAEDVDFTKDETIESEPEGKSTALNLSMYIAPAVGKCINICSRFCEDTRKKLKIIKLWKPLDKANVLETTTTVSVALQNVCKRLKRILDRDPSVTKDKFMKLGIPGHIIDTQLAGYRTTIENYLEFLSHLQTYARFLAAAIKKS